MDNKDFRKYHTHTLRHGYGRWMEENRYPPKFIRAQLRHRKTSTSQDMYGHFNRDDLQRMAATGPKQEW
jgi:integrase